MHQGLFLALLRDATRLDVAAGLEGDFISKNLKVGGRITGRVGVFVV